MNLPWKKVPARTACINHVWADTKPAIIVAPMSADGEVHIRAHYMEQCIHCSAMRKGEEMEIDQDKHRLFAEGQGTDPQLSVYWH